MPVFVDATFVFVPATDQSPWPECSSTCGLSASLALLVAGGGGGVVLVVAGVARQGSSHPCKLSPDFILVIYMYVL